MVLAGEDPRFIFRRLLIAASEDIGLASPMAISVVMACAQAFEWVGMPEGQYHLAEATPTLATSPKSNSAGAYWQARAYLEEHGYLPPPVHIRDQNTPWARSVGPPRATSTRTTTRAVGCSSAICPRALREAVQACRSVMRSESPSLCGRKGKALTPSPHPKAVV